jgi:hypothetical protein
MKKNPNKAAGNWGALKNKPQNLVPFSKGGTTKQIDMKTNKKKMGGPSQKTKSVTRSPRNDYRTVEKTKSTPSSYKESSKTTRTINGALKGVPKVKGMAPSINPATGGSYMQNGGPMKKGSSTPPMTSPYMDKAGKAKMASPKTKAMEGQFKNTPPTGSNSLKTGVYRGPKVTPAQIKQFQEDWKKKERAATNPANKSKGSALTPLKRGGTVKKYQKGGKTGDPLKATADSTKYFYDKSTKDILNATKIIEKEGSSKNFDKAYRTEMKSLQDLRRQSKKGKPGYDINGYPLPTPVTPKGVANAVTKAAKRTAQAVSKKKK